MIWLWWSLAAWYVVGLVVAMRAIPWRTRSFHLRWLPLPDYPGQMTFGTVLAAGLLLLISTSLWPLFMRVGKLGTYGYDHASGDGSSPGAQDAERPRGPVDRPTTS